MDKRALQSLHTFLKDEPGVDSGGVEELLKIESSEGVPRPGKAEDLTHSHECVILALRVLKQSSALLHEGSITLQAHSDIEEAAVALLLDQIGEIHRAAQRRSAKPPSLEINGVDFTHPLIFEGIDFQSLRFNNCSFRQSLQFTAIRAFETINFSKCTIKGNELLIRLTSFPKPTPSSDWRPSFQFEDCYVNYLYALGAQVFLFFARSEIKAMNLDLPSGATAQFVDCRINDGIMHSVSDDFGGNDLVPRQWHLERGWTLKQS